MKKIPWIIVLIVTLAGCKKDSTTPNPTPGNTGKYFFSNSEWTGYVGTYGQTYPQPCYLHFNGESTVVLYVLFNMYKGNDNIAVDSMVGNITSIEEVAANQTNISVHFPLTNDDQVYTIMDKKTLSGGPAPASTAPVSVQFTTSVSVCPAQIPKVAGTQWTTNQMSGGPTDGMYEFPDLSFIRFDTEGNTSYMRNGKIITYTPPSIEVLVVAYRQEGPRLYFTGYNETSDKLIIYYGVLLPDGNTILADTRASRVDARLPYYFQTIFWYGPAGVTPNMHKL